MSNRLDESVGSELFVDDEKSVNERLNANSINAYKIKMKSDLQKSKDENYNFILQNQNQQTTISLNYNNNGK